MLCIDFKSVRRHFLLAGENVIDGTFDLQVFSAFRGTGFYQIAFRTMNVHIRCQIESN